MRTVADSRRLSRAVPLLVAAAVLGVAALVGQPALGRFRMLFLGLSVGVPGLLLLVQYPGLGLAAVACLSFTLPLTIGTGSEVSLTAPVLLIPALAAVWLVQGLRRGEVRLPASRTVLSLALFLLCGLVSLTAGRAYWDPLVPQPNNLLLVQLGQWGIFALSALIFVVAEDLGARGRWLQIATFAFLVVASAVVLAFYSRPLLRILDVAGSANRSMFWVWLGALATGQLVCNRRLRPALRLWLVVLLAGAAHMVWFRQNDWVSGWVPFTVAVVAVVWLRIWRDHRGAGLAVGILLLVVAIMLYPVLFEHAGGEQELRLSWGGRQALYGAVLDLVKEHPILGLGPAAYRHYGFTRWLGSSSGGALWIRPQISSHNNYIDVYAQMGLVGLGLFVWFLAEVGLVGWRLAARFQGDFRDGYVNGVLGGFAGTLVAMMLADWFLPFVYNIGFHGFRTSALAWMFLGGLLALEAGPHKRPEAVGRSDS